jgi:RimJ/RimL family protein N-acetyltransferase
MLERRPEALSDGTMRLRDISQLDAELLYAWRMEESTRLMFRHTQVVALEFHRARIASYLDGAQPDRWFIIEVAQTRLGTISLYNFSEDRRTCEWGRFIIAPEARNLGFGRQALKLLIRYAQSIGISKLNCDVLDSNTIALHLYQDLGFTKIGARDFAGRNFLTLATDLDIEACAGPVRSPEDAGDRTAFAARPSVSPD